MYFPNINLIIKSIFSQRCSFQMTLYLSLCCCLNHFTIMCLMCGGSKCCSVCLNRTLLVNVRIYRIFWLKIFGNNYIFSSTFSLYYPKLSLCKIITCDYMNIFRLIKHVCVSEQLLFRTV